MLLTQGAFAEFGIFKMFKIKAILCSFCMHLYHFYPKLLIFTTVWDKICVDLLSYIRIGRLPKITTTHKTTNLIQAIVWEKDIAGLHPQSSQRFEWQPSAQVSQTLRSSHLSHMIAAAT